VSIGLTRILFDSELLDERALFDALRRANESRSALVAQFLDSVAIDRQVLTSLLRAPGHDEIIRVVPSSSHMQRLPDEFCQRLLAVPVAQSEDLVVVAMADVRDEHALHELSYHLDSAVRAVFADADEIQRAITAYYRPDHVEPRTQANTPMWASMSLPDVGPDTSAALVTTAREEHVPPSDERDEALPLPLVTRLAPPSDIPFPLVARKARRRTTDVPVDLGPTDRPTHIELAPIGDGARLLTLEELFRLEVSAGSELAFCATRGAVIAAVQRELSSLAKRVALFVVDGAALVGVSCNRGFGDQTLFAEVRFPYPGRHVLTKAIHRDGTLGRIEDTAENSPLLTRFSGFTAEVAVWPVFVDDLPWMVVLCDGLVDSMICTRRLSELATRAGSVLAKLPL
jgi:hypothetical protein